MRTTVFIIVALCLFGISFAQNFPSISTTWTSNINTTQTVLNITNSAHFDYPLGIAVLDVQIMRGSGILTLAIENSVTTYGVNGSSFAVSFSAPICRVDVQNLTSARVYTYSVFLNSSVPVEYKITLTRMSTAFSLNNTMVVESRSSLNGLYAFNAPEGEGRKNITITLVSSTADISSIISSVTIQPRYYCVAFPDSNAITIAAPNNTRQWIFSTMFDYSNFTVAFNPLLNGNFGDFTMLTMEANVTTVPYDFTYWKALIIAGAFLVLVVITGIVALALVRRRRSTYAPLN